MGSNWAELRDELPEYDTEQNVVQQKLIDKYFDPREGGFFDDLETWKRAIKRQHPKAKIKIKNGVHRAYTDTKVAVFGNLPGLGYITSQYMGSLMFGKNENPHSSASRARKYKSIRGPSIVSKIGFHSSQD